MLASLGLQEIVTYSLTSPEREAGCADAAGGGRARDALRPARQPHRGRSRRDAAHAARRPARGGGRQQPAAPIGWRSSKSATCSCRSAGEPLPDEPRRVAVLMAGRAVAAGLAAGRSRADGLLRREGRGRGTGRGACRAGPGLRARRARRAAPRPHGRRAHRGRAGRLGRRAAPGRRRALRPQGARPSSSPNSIWTPILAHAVDRHPTRPVPVYPPVKEDLAFVLDRSVPVARVARGHLEGRRAAAGRRRCCSTSSPGEQARRRQAQPGVRLTYQAPDRTLTDADAKKIRDRVVNALATELGAVLRA